MTLLFDQALDACIKHAMADEDEDAKRLFRKGDIAHLQRWRDDGRAAAIWEALRPGKSSDAAGMLRLVLGVLKIRAMAEELDGLQKRIAKARPNFKKDVAPLGLLRKEFANLDAILKQSNGIPMDFLRARKWAVRSNQREIRQKTIFCRLASDILRQAGRWHDKEVAALCEIAFDSKDVTTDMVRSAREAGRREATRKKR